jgi:hypothetical protein
MRPRRLSPAAAAIGTAAFTAPGQINWFTNGNDAFIQFNTNADATVDGIIQLNGVRSPHDVRRRTAPPHLRPRRENDVCCSNP